MNLPKAISLIESTAQVIEQGLATGRWVRLPGERKLAEELDVSRSTLRQALHLLTKQGRLVPPEQGRRRITGAAPVLSERRPTIGILTGHDPLTYRPSTQRFLLELRHALSSSDYQLLGGLPNLAAQCRRRNGLEELVNEHHADLWLIVAGTWEQLEFFSMRPEPALAVGGRNIGLPIASVGFDYAASLRIAVRELLSYGHRRIVFLCERFIREAPQPGLILTAFHEEMRAGGIEPSAFHVPEWDDTPGDLQRTLRELFQFTPPTAIIVNSPTIAIGAIGFCTERRLRIPHDLSLISGGDIEDSAWIHPAPSMISNSGVHLLPPILRWIASCERGRPSKRQVLLATQYERGQSVGPVSPAHRVKA